jgi:cell fate regulator YaaT (PSP1 superfamily)
MNWFDPNGLEPEEGDVVIVKTDRGEEMGVVRAVPTEVEDSAVDGELTSLVRIATEDDLTYALELGEKEKEAFGPFRDFIEKNELEMKPIDIEYLFGGDKIVFYFTSENRVDFRQLVKDLANHVHLRIDMRQMGARDQARMVGGLGRCGDELCCARFSGTFEPVSIRMAKAQGLPPNPTKISGACGRLM